MSISAFEVYDKKGKLNVIKRQKTIIFLIRSVGLADWFVEFTRF